jgi:hypothetical protein
LFCIAFRKSSANILIIYGLFTINEGNFCFIE